MVSVLSSLLTVLLSVGSMEVTVLLIKLKMSHSTGKLISNQTSWSVDAYKMLRLFLS